MPPDLIESSRRRGDCRVDEEGYKIALEVIVERPALSDEARQSLEERLRFLEEERIPRLEDEVADASDPSIVATLSEARQQAARLRHALSIAVSLVDAPHDPTKVELGDTVRLRPVGSPTVEEFTLVGELEARLDDNWVSVQSPMGAALVGSGAGDVVEISSPGGKVKYEVLNIERLTRK
jgi:transcription elongation GreA/GreB family factor